MGLRTWNFSLSYTIRPDNKGFERCQRSRALSWISDGLKDVSINSRISMDDHRFRLDDLELHYSNTQTMTGKIFLFGLFVAFYVFEYAFLDQIDAWHSLELCNIIIQCMLRTAQKLWHKVWYIKSSSKTPLAFLCMRRLREESRRERARLALELWLLQLLGHKKWGERIPPRTIPTSEIKTKRVFPTNWLFDNFGFQSWRLLWLSSWLSFFSRYVIWVLLNKKPFVLWGNAKLFSLSACFTQSCLFLGRE